MANNVIRDSSGAITGIMQGGQVVSIDTIRSQSSQQQSNLPPAASQQVQTPAAPPAQTNVTLTPVTFSHDAGGNVVTKAVVPTVQNPTLTPVTFSHDDQGNVVTKAVVPQVQTPQNTITLPAPFISNIAAIPKTGQVSPGVVEIGKGMYGNLSTLKLASSGNGGIPITPGSVKVTEEITKQSEPNAVNLISNFGANVYNEVAGIVGLQKVNATAGFQEKVSTISYEQKVPAPFISQNLRGYNSPDIVLNTKQSDVTTEKSLYSDVGGKIGASLFKQISIEDVTYPSSLEAKALSSIGGGPAADAGLKSAYIGAYETVRNNPLDVVKYASEGILLSGAFEGVGIGVGAITKGTRLKPVVSALSNYKVPEIALGATVGYGVSSEVTAGFSDFSTSAAYRAGQISVPLASMGVGAGIYSMKPLPSEDIIKPTTKSSEIIKPAMDNAGKTDIVTGAYELSRGKDPISNLIAKQAFERRTEVAVRNLDNAGKTDIVTRAYEMSRKEPAVAPWERDTIPTSFDLKTLTVGKATKTIEVSLPATEGVVEFKYDWNRARSGGSESIPTGLSSKEVSSLTNEQRAAVQKLLSNVPDPKSEVREPALQSWEREEFLKKLYPEEYGDKQGFGERVVDFKPTWNIGKSSGGSTIKSSSLLEPKRQLEATAQLEKKSLPYKEPVDTARLNRLLPSEDTLNRLKNEVESPLSMEQRTSLQNLLSRTSEQGKSYDQTTARKMGTVAEYTSPAPKVLLQLQSRVSPASKASAYAEVSPYTSVPSELELSAINERSQRVGIASDARSSIDTKAIVMVDLGASPLSKIETRTILDTEPMRETLLDVFPYPKIDIGTQRTTRDITITDTLPKIETVTTPRPYETTIFGGGGKIPPFTPWLPSPSGGGGAGGAKDPFRKIQREILYIGPRSYGPKRVSKKRKK